VVDVRVVVGKSKLLEGGGELLFHAFLVLRWLDILPTQRREWNSLQASLEGVGGSLLSIRSRLDRNVSACLPSRADIRY